MYVIYLKQKPDVGFGNHSGFYCGALRYNDYARKEPVTTCNSMQNAYVYKTENGAKRAARRLASSFLKFIAIIYKTEKDKIDKYNYESIITEGKIIEEYEYGKEENIF